MSPVTKREHGERFDLVDGQHVGGELSVQLQFGSVWIGGRWIRRLGQGAVRDERELSRVEFYAGDCDPLMECDDRLWVLGPGIKDVSTWKSESLVESSAYRGGRLDDLVEGREERARIATMPWRSDSP